MKTFYWALAFVLAISMTAYGTWKDSATTCEPPQVKHRFLQ
ncbi:hypothetical protein [Pseudomonas sp. PB103]|nr:hypothetical protein [Pseudomonas sp. PB103]